VTRAVWPVWTGICAQPAGGIRRARGPCGPPVIPLPKAGCRVVRPRAGRTGAGLCGPRHTGIGRHCPM